MTKKWAMIFPGQGSQSTGMLSELYKNHKIIEETFSEASSILSYDLWALIQSDPEGKLNQTCYTQPAVFVADIALWRCWQTLTDLKPTFVAGHSLGEYAALVCAESLSFKEGVELVKNRAKFMQSAVPEGQGAMAAIIALDNETLESLCQEESSENDIVMPANFNSIGQSVVAGHKKAVLRLIEEAKNKGAKIAKLLPVSVPSHCALMVPAAVKLTACLESIEIKQPIIPVIQNYDVKAHSETGVIKEALIKQLTMPVRWVETVQTLAEQKNDFCIECGPGKVLKGLNKRITKNMPTYNLLTEEDIHQALDAVKGD